MTGIQKDPHTRAPYQMSDKARKTAGKYRGDIASGYNRRRQTQVKWLCEESVMRCKLDQLPDDTHILDCPVGTGRFIDYYESRGWQWTGGDISPDMLKQAEKVAASLGNDHPHLYHINIFDLPFEDNAFDISLAIRIMNLITVEDMRRALSELQRVTKHQIIFNLRVDLGGSRFRNPRKLTDVYSALDGDWKLAEDCEIHEEDFRLLTLKRDYPAPFSESIIDGVF